jgi:hypothetical protein
MPSPVSPKQAKRKLSEQSHSPQHQLKRQKLSQLTSAYWDNLSKVWLTKDALEELDRRNDIQARSHPSTYQGCRRPLTRSFHTESKKQCGFAPDPICDCAPEYIKAVKEFSMLGGPDLSDLRNVCNDICTTVPALIVQSSILTQIVLFPVLGNYDLRDPLHHH